MTPSTTGLGSDRTSDDQTTLELIESVYAQMGLATAQERAQFLIGSETRPKLTFDVVISTSSQPFV